MPKNTTINLRVDAEIKEQAGEILASLGLTLSEAFNLLLHQVRIVRGLPFEIKQRLPIELNDGFGSYICEYGHLHDYSKLDLDSMEMAPKTYNSFREILDEIDAEIVSEGNNGTNN